MLAPPSTTYLSALFAELPARETTTGEPMQPEEDFVSVLNKN